MKFSKLISISSIININYLTRNKKELEEFINMLTRESLNDYLT